MMIKSQGWAGSTEMSWSSAATTSELYWSSADKSVVVHRADTTVHRLRLLSI